MTPDDGADSNGNEVWNPVLTLPLRQSDDGDKK